MKEYRWFYETVRVFANIVIPLFIKLRVVGVEHVPKEGPVLLVSNHLNWTDIPLIGWRLRRRTHFMAKVELFQKAPLRWLVIGLGAFPVRRGEADRQAIKQAEEVLKAGQVLVIFPEGTRSRTRMMKEGLPGAALIALRSGAPVVPVGIYGSERFKLWQVWPFRTQVTLTYGKPFTLSREGRKGHGDLQAQLDVMMRRIAELLPPQYQGRYTLSEGKAEQPMLAVPEARVMPDAGDASQASGQVVETSEARNASAEQG